MRSTDPSDGAVRREAAVGDDLERQVIAMLAEERGVPASKLASTTRLLDDLGMDGDDADEFFRDFGARFSVDLTPLRANWRRHFGQEGIPVLAGLASIAAGVGAMLLSAVVFGANGLAAGATGVVGTILGMLWLARRGAARMLPVTIADLAEAARTGRWPIDYGDP